MRARPTKPLRVDGLGGAARRDDGDAIRVVFDSGRGQRVPVWIWARAPSGEAIRQLEHIASMPYVVDRVSADPEDGEVL